MRRSYLLGVLTSVALFDRAEAQGKEREATLDLFPQRPRSLICVGSGAVMRAFPSREKHGCVG
jgi:hypothetical protein